MTLPNGIDGISSAIGNLFAVTGDPSILSSDSSNWGLSSISNLINLTQENVTNLLKVNVIQNSPNWNGSSTGVFQGIGGGLPGMFITFLGQMLGISPDELTALEGDLNSFLGMVEQVPILGQLIEALTGGNVSGSSGMPGLADFFNIIPGASNITDLIEQVVAQIPIAGPIIDTFLSYLLGTPTTGGTTSDLSSALGNIPLVGQLLEIFTGSSSTGGGGLGGLTSVFTDLLGAIGLNSTSGLGSGDPLTFLADIPVFGPLIEALTGGNVTSSGGLGGLASFFNFAPGTSDILSIITAGVETLAQNVLDIFTGFLGGPSSGATTGDLSGLIGNFALIPDLLSALTGGNITSGGLGALTSFFNFAPGTSDILSVLATAGADFAQLVESFIPGFSGGTQTDFNSIIGNMLSMLGNPLGLLGGSFDPISAGSSMLQNILTPAGALSSFTQLPAHLFGIFAPNNLTNELQSADSGFDDSSHFAVKTYWDGTVGRTVNSSIVGSLKFTANGSYQQFVGVPIGADSSQTINMGIYAHWQGLVTTAGQQIVLAAEAYDAKDVLIPNPTGRVIMAISNATTDSSTYGGASSQQPPVPAQGVAGWDGGAVPGWVYLSGPYKPPAGAAYVRISPEITTATQAGQVNFDDSYMMHDQGLFDASILTNFENMVDGLIPGSKVGGLQGIEDVLTAFQHQVDGLFNFLNLGGATQQDVPFFDLFQIMQTTALNAFNAAGLSSTNTNILGNKVNKQATTAGLQPSGEANFSHSDGPFTATTLATGQAMGGWVRIGQQASKGFVDMLMAKTAGVSSGISFNIFKHNASDGLRTKVWPNPGTTTPNDITVAVPATTVNHTQVLIPGGVGVNPNEVYWGEIVNNSGSNMTVWTKNTGIPDHFNTQPKNYGMTRTVATKGVSPTSLADTDVTSSGQAPVMTMGIASVPADYHLPQQDTFPPAGSGAGTYPWTIPSFIATGDIIDLIGVGGGGSGQSEWNAGIMAGGLGGGWGAGKFVYGSDIHGTGLPVIPAGTTTLNCVIGAGGVHPGFYWADGNPGSATQWWLGAVGTGTLLVTCAGGSGGTGSVGLSNGQGSAPSPNPYLYDGRSYPGGSNVGINATGASPGGGGGGATWYELGGSGAPGGAWAYAYKWVS